MEKINAIKCVIVSMLGFDDYGQFSLTRCAYFESTDGEMLVSACRYYETTESYLILISLIIFGLVIGFLIGKKLSKKNAQ